MRIAFIGQKGIGPGAPKGGVETYVEELSTRLAATGHEVTVFARTYDASPPPPQVWAYKGVRVRQAPTLDHRWFEAITSSFCATFLAVFGRYDIVNFQGIGPGFFSFLIRWFSPRAKVVLTFHSRDYEHPKWPWFGRAFFKLSESVSLANAHATVAIARHIADYVFEEYGQRIIHINQGAALAEPVSFLGLARKWGLKTKRFILFVARLEPHKGAETLITAYKMLPSNLRREFKLVLVGGTDNAGFLGRLGRLAKGARGVVLTGWQSRGQTSALSKNCYLFVLPSASEGLSLALLEAMLAGRPALVSDISANVEAVPEPEWQFKLGDAGDLAQKLERFLGAPKVVEQAGKVMYARVSRAHSWVNVFKQYEDLFKKLIS